MTGMVPILVLVVILLIAGYVVYRSMVEERRGDRTGGFRMPTQPPPPAQPPQRPTQPGKPGQHRPGAPGDPIGSHPGTGAEMGPDRPAEPPDSPRASSSGEAADSGAVPSEASRPQAPASSTASRARGTRRRRAVNNDPALAEHVGKLREAVDAQLISNDEAVASLIRSSGGALDDDSARAILAQADQSAPRRS